MRTHVLAVLLLWGTGCIDKQAADPGEVVREETVQRIGPPSRATSRTVRCGCAADGLHVAAPQGSKVTVPEDATTEAEAEVVLPDDEPARPIRRSRSLGFIGDAPLGPSASRGGPWNVPDALLPPHAHGARGYNGRGYRSGAGYGGATYPPGYYGQRYR